MRDKQRGHATGRRLAAVIAVRTTLNNDLGPEYPAVELFKFLGPLTGEKR